MDGARELLELSDLAWFRTDADRNVTAWSPAMERLTGYREDEVLGMPCTAAYRCSECQRGCGVRDHGEVRDAAMDLFPREGGSVGVRKSGRVWHEGGVFAGTVEIVRVQRDQPQGDMDELLHALGRTWLLLDAALVVTGVSSALIHRLDAPVGRHASELLGVELFGDGGSLTRALADGARREGWRATLQTREGPAPVSLSAAPTRDGRTFVMIRPDEADLEVADFEGMIGRSPAMQRIFRLIDLLRDNDATVLVTGDSGTGKELVAHALHRRSHRAAGPFVAVNCAALPRDLLESELFGHVRGAFTGATRDRVGRFEMADGGTLFLDEIGDLPLGLQAKLLRVLQDRAFERVGEGVTRAADVRIVAATNADLATAIAEGRFREDLYYRLSVVPIHIPPLSARPEDLEPLVDHLVRRIGRSRGRALRLSPEAMRALLQAPWPGNVRQLENALEFATAVCEGQTVAADDLPPELRAAARPPSATPSPEAQRIREALEATHYHKARAAELLGMSRSTLWRRMKALGLHADTD